MPDRLDGTGSTAVQAADDLLAMIDDAIGWAGVGLDEFPVLTVTAESVAGPQDALQGSSGDVVLKAQVGPACPGG